MKKLRGLYAITPETPDSAQLLALSRAALDGGIAMLQYRAKGAEPGRRIYEALELRLLCRAHGVPFIVNDDPALALECDADGVHLGREDGALASARRILRGKILGASCYDQAALARAAVAAGVHYVAFGSVFPSPTKPGAVRAPLALFGEKLGVPLCAIGGITLANAPRLIAAGASLLAVISDLFEASDVTARAREYKRLFDEQQEAV